MVDQNQGLGLYNLEETRENTIFVIGCLGAGKSTVMAICEGEDLDATNFEASNSNSSCTKQFHAHRSTVLVPNVTLVDSPGLNDPDILPAHWIDMYNLQCFEHIKKVSLVVVVIERQERCATNTLELFTMINKTMSNLKKENIAIIYNKCSEDDVPEDVLKMYTEAREGAKAWKLPVLTDCKQILIVDKVSGIKKSMKGDELKKA